MKTVLKVYRQDLPHGNHRYDSFSVQLEEGATVLTALLQVKDEQDESLAFRRSCRSGVCGSCAMTINGKAAFACKTRVVEQMVDTGEVTLEPLQHLPVVRDLVVDLGAFWGGLQGVRPWLVNRGPFPLMPQVQPLSDEEIEGLDRLIDCNLCAACHSECLPSGQDPGVPGAAALAKTYRFILDPRDDLGTARIGERIQDSLRAWSSCSNDACPRGVKLEEALSQMNRMFTMSQVGRETGP